MSKSKGNNSKQLSSLYAEDCISSRKKNLRQPLRCKKNVINIKRTLLVVLDRRRESCSVEKDKFCKSPLQKTHMKCRSSNMIKIDSLSKTPQKKFLKSPKQALRSSSRHEVTLHSNKDPLVGKSIPEDESLKLPRRTSRSSSRHKRALHSNRDSVIGKNMSVKKSLKSPKRAAKSSSRLKMTLHSNRDPVVGKNISEEESLKLPKRVLRSSSRHKVKSHFNEDPLVDKNISEKESLKLPRRASRSSSIHKGSLHSNRDPVVSKNMSEEKSLKRSKQASKLSSSHKKTLYSNDNCVVDNDASEHKSKGQENVFSENTSLISQTMLLKPSNKTKRSSFYRHNLTSQNNWESDKQTKITKTTPTNTVPVELVAGNHESQKENVSKKLRSQESSNSAQLPSAQETEHIENTTVTQKAKGQPTRIVKRLSKHLPSFLPPKHKPNMKRSKCVRKSGNLKTQVKSTSFSGNIPIDDLALPLSNGPRKTKSDGFKYPGRNTLKRKRFIMNAMKMADEEYEDDIYETKQFEDFKRFFPDSSDSDLPYAMTTPKLGFPLTPIIRRKTPLYKDCFSPTEYAMSRKVAEACLYKNKRRKNNYKEEMPEIPKKKLEFSKVVENACKVQKEVDKLIENKSDNEDSYFTDVEI